MSIPHGVGEVWAQVAWEAYWALVDVHGFDPDLTNLAGAAGNVRAMLYVNEGLKNTPCSPDFTDVRDVVRAYRLLMTMGIAGDVYHVCSGVDRPIQALAEMLVARANSAMRLETDPELLRPVDLGALRGDPSKIQRATGWTAEIPIDRTLNDILEFWRSVPPHEVGSRAGT